MTPETYRDTLTGATQMTTKSAELELTLKPNKGWTVNVIRDGQNEGPTHSGYFPSKTDAMNEADDAAARMFRRGISARIRGCHGTIWR